MKRSNIYIICLIVFFALVAGIIFNYKNIKKEEGDRVYALLPRKGAAATTAEWKDIKKRADVLLAALQQEPEDLNASLELAALYIQEARETGNHVYYDKAAMKYVNNALKNDPSNFTGLVYKSLLYLSQHHFAEGLAAAQKAQKINPHNAYVYGLLVDGYVEMGQYDSAVAHADRMVAIRPDLTSYSRISYLREIFGNDKGAIEAMTMAVQAGVAGEEHTEWTRAQLGSLYEKTGDYKAAEELYNISLAVRPDYPYALSGLGRIAMAKNDYKRAIAYLEKADSLIADNSNKEELTDLYRLTGQNKKADEVANKIITDLSKDAQAADKDDDIGHYSDRELAYAYLKINKVDKALEHALIEYNRRPENIDVNETVAWVYYNKGEYQKALPYIKVALKTNSKNPVLLSRAGLIFYKTGEKEMAKSMLQEVAGLNTFIGSALRAETLSAMQNM